jgi:hypothetical protein
MTMEVLIIDGDYTSEEIDNVMHMKGQRLFESCLLPGETE